MPITAPLQSPATMRARHGRGQIFHVPSSENAGRLASTFQHKVVTSLHSSGWPLATVIFFQPGRETKALPGPTVHCKLLRNLASALSLAGTSSFAMPGASSSGAAAATFFAFADDT